MRGNQKAINRRWGRRHRALQWLCQGKSPPLFPVLVAQGQEVGKQGLPKHTPRDVRNTMLLCQLHSAQSQLPFFSPPQWSECSNPSILQPREADLQHAPLIPADTLCAKICTSFLGYFVCFLLPQTGGRPGLSAQQHWGGNSCSERGWLQIFAPVLGLCLKELNVTEVKWFPLSSPKMHAIDSNPDTSA